MRESGIIPSAHTACWIWSWSGILLTVHFAHRHQRPGPWLAVLVQLGLGDTQGLVRSHMERCLVENSVGGSRRHEVGIALGNVGNSSAVEQNGCFGACDLIRWDLVAFADLLNLADISAPTVESLQRSNTSGCLAHGGNRFQLGRLSLVQSEALC